MEIKKGRRSSHPKYPFPSRHLPPFHGSRELVPWIQIPHWHFLSFPPFILSAFFQLWSNFQAKAGGGRMFKTTQSKSRNSVSLQIKSQTKFQELCGVSARCFEQLQGICWMPSQDMIPELCSIFPTHFVFKTRNSISVSIWKWSLWFQRGEIPLAPSRSMLWNVFGIEVSPCSQTLSCWKWNDWSTARILCWRAAGKVGPMPLKVFHPGRKSSSDPSGNKTITLGKILTPRDVFPLPLSSEEFFIILEFFMCSEL